MGSPVSVSTDPRAIAANGLDAYVVNSGDDSVSVIRLFDNDYSGQVPRTPLQAYEPVVGQSCGHNVPDWLNWPGLIRLSLVGWELSWQWWSNGDRDGAVCTSQPIFQGFGTWTIS